MNLEVKMLEILKRIGLSEAELLIYEALLNYGELSAGMIIEKTKLKRGDCYNKIYELVKKGLVEEFNKNKKKYFRLEHPNKVQEYIEKREIELDTTKKEIAAIMPNLISTFNLAYHKPGVKYFEGQESFAKMMGDSLTAKEVIYSYVDPEGVDKYLDPKVNMRYIRDSERLGIKKRILVEDNPENRARYEKLDILNTQVRYIGTDLPNFSTTMQIYDNKITFHTLKPNNVLGIIIEDQLIYRLQRALFEFIWERAEI